jgi:hypothetical protein
MSSHRLDDAIVRASLDGLGYEGMPVLVRGNTAPDDSLADFRQNLPNALSGERFAALADEEHSIVRLL